VAWVAASITVVVNWMIVDKASILSVLGTGLSAWLVVGTLTEVAVRIQLFKTDFVTSLRRLVNIPRSSWGMTCAHAGLGIAVAGMIGSTVWRQESIQVMKIDQSVELAGYTYTFHGVREAKIDNYVAEIAAIEVTRYGERFTVLYPENRVYPVQGRPTTEAAIYSTFWADLYVALGTQEKDGSGYVVRIFHNPLVLWLWFGTGLLVFGSVISLTDRRHRIGAPAKAKSRMVADAAPAE